jgi:hypothetical protein
MAKMPSTLGDRAIPRATRRAASFDPSGGLALTRRGSAALGDGYDDLGRGLQVASNALYEEQLKDEERAVKNLEVEWSKKRREILFGDGTPNKPGFFSTSGEDTLNSRKGVEEELNKARAGILGKASSPRVKQAFDLSSTTALQGELEQVDRYTITQRKAANLATSKAAIEEAVQQASTYFSDDGKWDAAVTRIANEMASMGDEQGWSQEVINTETQKVISQAASDRVKRALLTDAAAGETIYSKTRGMIDGDMRIEIEQDIKTAKKAEEVDRRLARAEHEAALARQDKAAFGEWATRILSGDSVSVKDIALDSRMDGQSKFALANALESKAGAAPPKDHSLFNNLFARIHLPEGHPDKITDWKELTPFQAQLGDFSMFEQLRQEVENVGTDEGKIKSELLGSVMTYARNSLTSKDPNFGISDPEGEERLQQATVIIQKAWEEGLKAGISPYELSDVNSKHYVGKVVDQLKRPMSERIKSMMQEMNGLDLGLGEDEASPNAVRGRLGTSDLPVVETDADFEALAPGTKFKDKDGTVYTKPGK